MSEDEEAVEIGGNWHGVLVAFVAGVVLSFAIFAAITANSDLGEPRMMGSDKFCKEHDYQNGYYTSGLTAPTTDDLLATTAGITCFNDTGSHLEDTWTTTAVAQFYVKSDYTVVNKTVEGGTE